MVRDEYFKIGWESENAVIEIKKIQNNKSYNKYMIEDPLEIVKYAKTALISKYPLKEELVPYYKIFPHPLNHEDLEERKEKSRLAYKTIHTLKKMLLEKIPSENELEVSKKFLNNISNRCSILRIQNL